MKNWLNSIKDKIINGRYESVRYTTIWGDAILLSSFWLAVFIINLILNNKIEPLIFVSMFITFTSVLIGIYDGITLKSLKQLKSYTEYNNKKQKDILGCDVKCDRFGEYSICIYDYSCNSLLLSLKEATCIATLQDKNVEDMITVETPVEIIINSPESAYTIVVTNTINAERLIDAFINGGNLIELGFKRRQ